MGDCVALGGEIWGKNGVFIGSIVFGMFIAKEW